MWGRLYNDLPRVTLKIMQQADTVVDLYAHASPVDVVTYLASLVSQPDKIDSMLDTLRFITSAKRQGQPLLDEEKQSLQDLASQLQQYLIQKEPLRAFTQATLEQKLYEHFVAERKIRRDRRGAITVVGLMIASMFATNLLPVGTKTTRFNLAIAVAIVVGLFGALIFLLLVALRSFSDATKKAFYLISAGAALEGVKIVLDPILMIYYHSQVPWLGLWWLYFVHPLGYLLIYIGIRKLAEVLGVKNLLMNRWFVVLASLGLGLAFWLPLSQGPMPQASQFGLAVAAGVLLFAFRAATSGLTFVMWRRAQEPYRTPIKWLFLSQIAMLVVPIAFVGTSLAKFFAWSQTGQLSMTDAPIVGLLTLIAIAIAIRLGYTFNKLNRY